jgi:two-component system chemotaxis sensor kinase CheA
LDLDKIAEKAVKLGWRAADEPLEPRDALDIITRAGFSTRGEADLASGRGIGLDIVQKMVRTCGGLLSMESTPGKGTTFRMRLPLTLVIMDVLFIEAGNERYAAPRGAVERVIEVDPAAVVRTESNLLLHRQDGYFILHNLARLLHSAESKVQPTLKYGLQAWSEEDEPQENGSGLPVLVVDRVSDVREVVVHTLADPLLAQPGIAGATELANGSVVLILDIPMLMQLARKG